MNSIQDFAENGIARITDVITNFLSNPGDFEGLVKGIRRETSALEKGIIRDTLELADQKLRDSDERKKNYTVVKKDPRVILTSLGSVGFSRTYYANKSTGEKLYLVDQLCGLESRDRLTEDAKVRVLEEVVKSSYSASGDHASITCEGVSRQTVKDIVHSLEFPKEDNPDTKKVVDTLFIDADEDHVALQYLRNKGDVVRGELGHKNNGTINKLVYVYEGIEKEGPHSKRNRLKNVHYFAGAYRGEENAHLWDEVAEYLDSHYDMSKVQHIYLGADGGQWIKAGVDRIAGSVSVLDEFHMSKIFTEMTHFLLDSEGDVRDELKKAITADDKDGFIRVCQLIKEHAGDDQAILERVNRGEQYILSNWGAAVTRMTSRAIVCGCSAEGHVSHILSERMSSRPMGWSYVGSDQMAHLLAYAKNGRSLLELVRYQDKEERLDKAAGCETDPVGLSLAKILASEKTRHGLVGKYYDLMQASLGIMERKHASIVMHCFI